MRLLADYTGGAIDAERAAWVIAQAASFVDAIAQHLGDPGIGV